MDPNYPDPEGLRATRVRAGSEGYRHQAERRTLCVRLCESRRVRSRGRADRLVEAGGTGAEEGVQLRRRPGGPDPGGSGAAGARRHQCGHRPRPGAGSQPRSRSGVRRCRGLGAAQDRARRLHGGQGVRADVLRGGPAGLAVRLSPRWRDGDAGGRRRGRQRAAALHPERRTPGRRQPDPAGAAVPPLEQGRPAIVRRPGQRRAPRHRLEHPWCRHRSGDRVLRPDPQHEGASPQADRRPCGQRAGAPPPVRDHPPGG